jgi:hypothetical protein
MAVVPAVEENLRDPDNSLDQQVFFLLPSRLNPRKENPGKRRSVVQHPLPLLTSCSQDQETISREKSSCVGHPASSVFFLLSFISLSRMLRISSSGYAISIVLPSCRVTAIVFFLTALFLILFFSFLFLAVRS